MWACLDTLEKAICGLGRVGQCLFIGFLFRTVFLLLGRMRVYVHRDISAYVCFQARVLIERQSILCICF